MIEAWPGDRVVVGFRNRLPEPTNIHYHGLHIPSEGHADNVMLSIPSGESFTYEFDLPSSHPGGTYWYHPHVHGLAAQQVSRGLAGVFIVRGELDQIPEIASAPEYLAVLQDFELDRSGLPVEPSQMELMTGREGNIVTVNGSVNPSIPIQQGGWVRLRFLNASSSRFYRIGIDEHPLLLIATDGGALPAPEERDSILLAPGERAEVMILGARTEGSYRLMNLPYSRITGMGAVTPAPEVLAHLTYQGKAEQSWSLPSKLVTVTPLPEPSVRRSFLLGSGMGMGFMGGGGMGFTINGRLFNPNRVDTRVALDSVEDWEFVNASMMDHPMHIHTNPFQIIGAHGAPVPAWKDVIVVPARSRLSVRTMFRDFPGRTMYHCHILDHEDLGMMGVLEIAPAAR
jgi:FtsP/CotA-like multicopper oxidase with cupredoxin domain